MTFGILIKNALLLGVGASLVLVPQQGGDKILKRVQGEQRALLVRVEKYCYSAQADKRTCELYLREYTDYALAHEDAVHPEVAELPGRASLDPMADHHRINLKPLAQVIDSMGK